MAGIVIFKVECMLKPESLKKLRNSIIKQIKDGVVVIPPYMRVEYVSNDITENCEFRFLDKDGNVEVVV